MLFLTDVSATKSLIKSIRVNMMNNNKEFTYPVNMAASHQIDSEKYKIGDDQ